MLPHLLLEDLASPARGELAFAVAKAATHIVRGQCSEMGLRSGRIDWERYLAAARGKTGALLALPVLGALRLAGRPADVSERVAQVFQEVGVLFQLQDDLVDLYGDKGRREVGGDIYEGKISALVVAQLQCAPSSRGLVLELLDRPRELTTTEDVQLLATLFERSGARAHVLGRITALRARILGADVFREQPELLEVSERIVTWTLAPLLHLLPAEPSTRAVTGASA